MATEQFTVNNRWTGKPAFTAEIETTPEMTRGWKLRLAVAWALAASVPCNSLDLNGSDFSDYVCPVDSSFVDSSFVDSSFVRSSFVDSIFVDSIFVDSIFVGSRFVGSRFVGSRFVGSSFVDSIFVRSSFVDSIFVDSIFVGSRFVGSRFVGSRFVGSSFVDSIFVGEDAAKADFLTIIAGAWPEIPGLIAALREGRVNGSTYTGECACLVGTIANVRRVDVELLEKDSSRPAEVWFLMIYIGDKPGDSSPGGYASGRALEWALEYASANGIEVPAAQA